MFDGIFLIENAQLWAGGSKECSGGGGHHQILYAVWLFESRDEMRLLCLWSCLSSSGGDEWMMNLMLLQIFHSLYLYCKNAHTIRPTQCDPPCSFQQLHDWVDPSSRSHCSSVSTVNSVHFQFFSSCWNRNYVSWFLLAACHQVAPSQPHSSKWLPCCWTSVIAWLEPVQYLFYNITKGTLLLLLGFKNGILDFSEMLCPY